MAKHEIEIEITKTGEVRVHVKGVRGKGCLAYAKLFQDIIGKIKEQRLTEEYYLPDKKVRIHVEQKRLG